MEQLLGKKSCCCQHGENEASTASLDGSAHWPLTAAFPREWLRVTVQGWGLVLCWGGIGATTQDCTEPRPPALKGGVSPALLPHSFLSKEKMSQETRFSGN